MVLALATTAGTALKAQDEGPKAARRASHRVPAHFGQLGLSAEQRQRIYSIQDRYAEKIANLQQQLDAARARARAECEAVLTDAQKQRLAQYQSAPRGRAPAIAPATPQPAPEPTKAAK